jgi:hypothetical protein
LLSAVTQSTAALKIKRVQMAYNNNNLFNAALEDGTLLGKVVDPSFQNNFGLYLKRNQTLRLKIIWIAFEKFAYLLKAVFDRVLCGGQNCSDRLALQLSLTK